jgi:imidazolonepropionase-like amidohydrolase
VAPVTYSDEATAFVHANIITMQTEEPVRDAILLSRNGRIDAIIPGSHQVNARYKQIVLKGAWVLSGLVDIHIYLNQSGSAFARPDIIDATRVTSY